MPDNSQFEILGDVGAPPAAAGTGAADKGFEILGDVGKPIEEGPDAVKRGIVQGLKQIGPKTAASILEMWALGVPDAGHARQMWEAAQDLNRFGEKLFSDPKYASKAKRLEDVANWSDFATIAGEQFGQGMISTLPVLAGGIVGTAATGGSPVGGALGMIAPSYAQNAADLYEGFKQEGLHPRAAKQLAKLVGIPVTGLDVLPAERVVGNLTGNARNEAIKGFSKRLVNALKEAGVTGGMEATTEAAQQAIQELSGALATGKDPLAAERWWNVLNAGLGGLLVGGATGFGGGLVAGKPRAATEQQPGQQPPAAAGSTGLPPPPRGLPSPESPVSGGAAAQPEPQHGAQSSGEQPFPSPPPGSQTQTYAVPEGFEILGDVPPAEQPTRQPGQRDVVAAIEKIESGGNPFGKPATSSATGYHGFIDSTWMDMVRRYRPDLLQGRTPKQVLALRYDHDISTEITGHYADENQRALAQAGLDPTPPNTYLAHFLGAGGAKALLNSRPGTTVDQILPQHFLDANPGILTDKEGRPRQAGYVVRWATARMRGAMASHGITMPGESPDLAAQAMAQDQEPMRETEGLGPDPAWVAMAYGMIPPAPDFDAAGFSSSPETETEQKGAANELPSGLPGNAAATESETAEPSIGIRRPGATPQPEERGGPAPVAQPGGGRAEGPERNASGPVPQPAVGERDTGGAAPVARPQGKPRTGDGKISAGDDVRSKPGIFDSDIRGNVMLSSASGEIFVNSQWYRADDFEKVTSEQAGGDAGPRPEAPPTASAEASRPQGAAPPPAVAPVAPQPTLKPAEKGAPSNADIEKMFDEAVDEAYQGEKPKPEARTSDEWHAASLDFAKKLDERGAARSLDGDYKIIETPNSGFAVEITKDGIRTTLGGGYPAAWTRERAIQRAVEEAFPLGDETPTTTEKPVEPSASYPAPTTPPKPESQPTNLSAPPAAAPEANGAAPSAMDTLAAAGITFTPATTPAGKEIQNVTGITREMAAKLRDAGEPISSTGLRFFMGKKLWYGKRDNGETAEKLLRLLRKHGLVAGGETAAPVEKAAEAPEKPKNQLVQSDVGAFDPQLLHRSYGHVRGLVIKFIKEFASNPNAKELMNRAGEYVGAAGYHPGTTGGKITEEVVEAAFADAIGTWIMAGREDQLAERFDSLVRLYEAMPAFATRTGTSAANQAYSTPAPLAFLLGNLASRNGSVLEPTAGTGMLLLPQIGENRGDKVHANEIDPLREQLLKEQASHFQITNVDATTDALAQGPFDTVLMNPPFGKRLDASGRPDIFLFRDDAGKIVFRTPYLDEAITLNAAKRLKRGGDLLLIMGGPSPQTIERGDKARMDHYAGEHAPFHAWLHRNFDVGAHFTMLGDFYRKQGAGWPIDVIVAKKRSDVLAEPFSKSDNKEIPSFDEISSDLPANKAPELISDWKGVYDALVRARGWQSDYVRRQGERPGSPEGLAAPGEPAEQPAAGNVRGGTEPGQDGVGAGERAGEHGGVHGGAEQRSPVPEQSDAGRKDVRVPDGERDNLAVPEGGRGTSERPGGAERGGLGDAVQRGGQPGLADERSTAEVAKSAAKKTASALDEAAAGLFELFGGGDPTRLGSGPTFDEQTYAKAKPLFIKAVKDLGSARDDIGELLRRLIKALKDTYNFTAEQIAKMRPYITRFAQDVRDGVVEVFAEKKEAAPVEENELQAVYEPASSGTRMETLTPVSLAAPVRYALDRLEAKVGDISEFVRKELGYDDRAQFDDAFSAEMRDAAGLAIDNLKAGRGFVIGDQTGVGKGRFVAGMIRWARRNGAVPVFVTEKPGLYADMLRDLWDIGERDIKALPTNNNLRGKSAIKPDDPDNTLTVQTPSNLDAVLTTATPAALAAHGFNAVFTTYDQMNTKRGKLERRHEFLRDIAPNAIFVFDESHNAVGTGMTLKDLQRATAGGKKMLPREIFVRQMLLPRAKGAVFSSATYAKRPDAMMLYAVKTDIGLAAPDTDIVALIKKGGIPMQQAIATLLSQSGQMVRREKSFKGIEFKEPTLEMPTKYVDAFSDSLADLAEFDEIAKEYIENAMPTRGGGWGGGGKQDVEAKINSTEFASLMHNIVDQVFAAMRSDAIADEVIKILDRGNKPVVAFDNTMGSILGEMVALGTASPGKPIDFGLHTLLQRYLARTLRYTVRTDPDPNVPAEVHYIPLEDLSEQHRAFYDELMKRFETRFAASNLPGSPIDWIIYRLDERGVKAGEITGREYRIDYRTGTLQARDATERKPAGKRAMIVKFNGGSATKPLPAHQRLEVMLLNRSGATGISLHAGQKFGDQRQREMILAQFEKNIDTFIQMLGRVNRTGQVVPPVYHIPNSNVAAENRMLAVLKKKLTSLQANVTASGKGQVDINKVPDFINEIGGHAVSELLQTHPEWSARLGLPPLQADANDETAEKLVKRATGRIALLPARQQEEFYNELFDAFNEEVAFRKATGQQIGAAEVLEADAKPVARQMYWPADGARVAQGPVYAAEVDMRILDPIPSWKGTVELLRRALGKLPDFEYDYAAAGQERVRELIDKESTKVSAAIERARERAEKAQKALDTFLDGRNFDEKLSEQDAKVAGLLEGSANNATADYDALRNQWIDIRNFLMQFAPGKGFTEETKDRGEVLGMVTNIERNSKSPDAASWGGWRIEISYAGREPSYLNVVASRLARSKMSGASLYDVRHAFNGIEEKYASGRENRVILLGNTVRAFARSDRNGRIVQVRDGTGRVGEGVLLPYTTESLDGAQRQALGIEKPEMAGEYLIKAEGGPQDRLLLDVSQGLPAVSLLKLSDGNVEISIRSKGGRRYYANPGIRQALDGRELVRRRFGGGPYQVEVPAKTKRDADLLTRVISAIMAAAPEGRSALTPTNMDLARQVHGLPKSAAQSSMKSGESLFGQMDKLLSEKKESRFQPEEPRINPEARAAIVKRIKQIVRQIVPSADVSVFDEIPGAPGVAGYYDPLPHLVEVALRFGDPDVAARHEAIHALRTIGLFTDKEWSLMERDAKSNGTLDRVNDISGYDHLSPDEKIEEAVAQTFGEKMAAGEPLKMPAGPLRTAWEKIKTFFRRLGNAIRGLGFKTAEDVYRSAEEGQVGARQTYPAEGTAAMKTASAASADTSRAAYVMREEKTGKLRVDLDAKRKPGESLVATVFGEDVIVENDRLFEQYLQEGIPETDRWKYGIERLRALAREHEATLAPKYSRFQMDDRLKGIAEKTFGTTDRSLRERLMDWGQHYFENGGRRAIQQVADRYRAWHDYERMANDGILGEASRSAYKGLRMAGRATPDVAYHLVYRGPIEVHATPEGGVTWRARQNWAHGGLKDIVEPLADRGILKLWELQRVTRRAVRLDREGREKLLKNVADSENMAIPELAQFINQQIAGLTPDAKRALNTASQRWEMFNSAMLDFAQDTGLISAESRSIFENADYIPFYRIFEDADQIEALLPTAGGSNSRHIRSPIKKLRGGEGKINPIVENMIANATSIASRGIANLAKRKAFEFARSQGLAKRLTVQDMMRSRQVKLPTVVAALRRFGWDVDLVPKNYQNHLVEMWLAEFPDSADVASVMVDGKPVYYRFADPDLMAGIVSVRIEQFNDLVNLMAPAKRLLTRGVTATPGFMARNFVRDTVATWMMTGVAPGLRTMRAALNTARKDPIYWEMMAGAATGGGFYSSEAGDLRRRLDRDNAGRGRSIWNVPKLLWEWWTRLGEISEIANRRSIYDWVKNHGGSDAEAAYHSVDLLDFGLRGASHSLQSATRILPFLNARIEGLYRMYRAFEDPTSSPMSKGIKQRVVAGMVANVLLRGLFVAAFGLMLEALSSDDPDYQDLPDWKKDNYWYFKGGLMIPKPFEFGFLFSTIPQRLYRLASGDDSLKDFGASMLSGIMNTLAFNPTPQAVLPVVEQLADKSFFPLGAPVVPQSIADLSPEYQFMPYTGETARQLGKATGTSPVRIERLIRGYTGDLGMYVLAATDGLLRAVLGKPEPPAPPIYFGETYGILDPIEKAVNDVYRSFHERKPLRSTKSMEEFYALRSQVETIASDMSRAKKTGDFAEVDKIRSEHEAELQIETQVRKAAERLSKLRKQQDQITEGTDTPVQKREALDKIQQERNDIAREFMQRPATLRVLKGIQEARQ